MRTVILSVLLLQGCVTYRVKPAPHEIMPRAMPRITRAKAPGWVTNLPQEPGYKYFVGEASNISNKDDALERAWYCALIRFGLTEFSELTKVSTQSTETMRSAEYRRDAAAELQAVNWTGLLEVRELGSPAVVLDEETGKYTVYRLVKWKTKDIETAHRTIKTNTPRGIPASPEAQQQQVDSTVDAVLQMKQLNKTIESRDAYLAKVMNEAKCGVKVSDLKRILKAPDKVEFCTYYWGTYQVFACEDSVTHITEGLGHGASRGLCNS